MFTARHQQQQTALLHDAALALTTLKGQQEHLNDALVEAVESGNSGAVADAVAAGASVGVKTGELVGGAAGFCCSS
jgi:hypothetical protein